jgi:hypothetical protein
MLATARDLRTTLWIADAVGEVGQDLIAAGEADGASRLAEAIELAGEAVWFGARPLLAQADLALREGRPADALTHARRFQQSFSELAVLAVDARRAEGEALVALGHPREGEALLRQAKADAAAHGAAPTGWRACLALARRLDAAGRPEEARAARAEARRAVERVASELSGAPELLRGFKASAVVRETTAA